MGVAALVKVIAQLAGKLGGGEAPRLVEAVHRQLLPVVPPGGCRVEVFGLHGPGLAEMLVAFRHIQPVEPGLAGGAGAVEKQDVGGDGGVGRKDAARQTDDGVQVEIRQQLLFDVQLGVVGAEQKAVGQDDRRAAAGLEPVHDDRQKQVGGFAAGEVCREVVFDVGLLAAAVGRIHQHHVELVVRGVVQHVVQQAVVVVDAGVVQVVQQKVGDAEHIGELLFLDAVDRAGPGRLIGGGLHLPAQLLEPAHQKAAGAAGKVGHLLADARADHPGHKVGDGAGRVELARRARALQLLQDRLVNFPKGVALLVVAQVQLVDHVDDLPQQDAVLHVGIGVGKDALDDGLADGGTGIHRASGTGYC